MAEPHIVRELRFTIGQTPVVIRFADDGYRHASQEELQERVQAMRRVAGRILYGEQDGAEPSG